MLLIHSFSFNNFHQMESAISLRYCPFPYSSKGFQGAGSIRFHLRFNHATPLSAPQFSATRHPVTRSVGHANCILGRFSQPSQNEGRSSKILRGVTGASLVLACVLGLFNFKMNPKLTTAHASSPSGNFDTSMFEGEVDPSEVEGQGRIALNSLLKIMNDAATHQNDTIPSRFSKLGPSDKEVNTLKSIAIGQSKSAKGGEALKVLEEQYMKCKNNFPEAEEYLGVALVEVFMLQEKLEEARKKLDEQIDQLLQTYSQIFHSKKVNKLTPQEKCEELLKLYFDSEYGSIKLGIAKRILYKAIVETMLEDKEERKWSKGNKEAKEWRKAFFKTF